MGLVMEACTPKAPCGWGPAASLHLFPRASQGQGPRADLQDRPKDISKDQLENQGKEGTCLNQAAHPPGVGVGPEDSRTPVQGSPLPHPWVVSLPH